MCAHVTHNFLRSMNKISVFIGVIMDKMVFCYIGPVSGSPANRAGLRGSTRH